VFRCSSDDGEILFRDEELLIDDKGLRLLDDMHGDQGWHHVLSSARRASAHAQVFPICMSAFLCRRTALHLHLSVLAVRVQQTGFAMDKRV